MSLILAQITDTHIREPGRLAYGRLDTAPYLKAAVRSVMALKQRPDAVLLTGDLTDFGRPAEYEHLAELLAPLSMPYYLMPGNHDDRDQMRRSFPSHSYLGTEGFIQYAINLGAMRLLALDTVETGASGGRLCPPRLAWLKEQLDEDHYRPTILALHHPPFKSLIGHMDLIGLMEGAKELETLVCSYRNVERIVSGHLHRTIYTRFGGTVASTAPSPAHQVCLDLSEDAPSQWCLEPPGYQLHAWQAGAGLLTHSVAIGGFEGPFPFHENGALID